MTPTDNPLDDYESWLFEQTARSNFVENDCYSSVVETVMLLIGTVSFDRHFYFDELEKIYVKFGDDAVLEVYRLIVPLNAITPSTYFISLWLSDKFYSTQNPFIK